MRSAFIVSAATASTLRALNYSPAVEAFRRSSDSRPHRKLGDLVSNVGRSYGSVFTRRDCDERHGIELLSQTDMFSAEPSGRIIRRDSMGSPHDHVIRPWQVLISGAGTLGETELYGRSIIADSRLSGKYVGPHAMALTFKDPGEEANLCAYSFLLSKRGIEIVRSASYGTKVLGLRKDILSDIPVPEVRADLASQIAARIRLAVASRESYHRCLERARQALEELPEMRIATEMCTDRRARCIGWRDDLPSLCAWNYASAGDCLTLLNKKWSGRLADVVPEGEIYYGPRFARIPCSDPYGIPFLTQRDVFLIRPVPRRIVHPGFPDRMLFVQENTLLVAGHGTTGEGEIFGKVALPCSSLLQSAFTQDILRINVAPSDYYLAYAFFSTRVGMRLLRSTAVGTKIMTMRADLLRRLPFPEVNQSTSSLIQQTLKKAIQARNAADCAEAEAVALLESEVLNWLT